MKLSFDQLRDRIYAALNPQGDNRPVRWVRELYDDRAIVQEEKSYDLFSIPYTVDEAGVVTLGDPTRVEVEYVRAERTVELAFKDGSGVPTEIQVIPFGRHETDKGVFVLDEEGAASVLAAFEAKVNDMVIDYEHATLYGGEAPAAGWIKRLVNKGSEGIWAVVEWTGRARRYLENREYRYLSPVFLKTLEGGRVVRLLHAGLTNLPAIDGMVPVVNKSDQLKPKKEVSRMKLLQTICKLLGLPEGTTEEQATEAVGAMKARTDALAPAMEALALKEGSTADDVRGALALRAVAHRDVLGALGLKPEATLSEVVGTVTAMKQGADQGVDLAGRVKDLEGKLRAGEAAEAVAAAMKAGKISAAQRDWATEYATNDPKGFAVFAAKAPQAVPVGSGGMGGASQGGGMKVGAAQLTAEDLMVCKQMQIKPEDYAASLTATGE
jgi:phage I-like protein